MIRKIVLTCSSLVLAAAALYFCLRGKEDPSFSPEKIASSLPPNPRWSIAAPVPIEERNLHEILSQKFTMFAEGEQAYCFLSEDQKHVLKFFKMPLVMPSWRDYLCPHFAAKRLQKLSALFNGYKSGFQDLREETGLIWIHLAKTTTLKQTITIFDKNGKEYGIDADATEFVIQEKAETVFHRLACLYEQKKDSEAEQAIKALYDLVQYQTEKGYMDRDKNVGYNYGFVGDRPVHIDLGRLYKRRDRKVRPKDQQLERFKQQIELWKSKNHS